MNTDFSMKIRSNGWKSDSVKYHDLVRDANTLVDILDDLDFNVEKVSFEFEVKMTYEQMMRLFKLLKKGAAHIYYHGGRTLITTPSVIRESGEVYVLGNLCTAKPDSAMGNGVATVSIVFDEIVKVKNQNTRGVTILANLSRLANAIAWSIENDVKLSDKAISIRTWNTITIWGDNPWRKDESKTEASEAADIYAEDV